jgi:hypothetical protein
MSKTRCHSSSVAVLDRAHEADGRVVHQHVDAAESARDFLHHVVQLGLVRHVRDECIGAGESLWRIAVDDRHASAKVGKCSATARPIPAAPPVITTLACSSPLAFK